jgi:hypothetical protein
VRASDPSIVTVRHLAVIGDTIVTEWADWLGDRMTASGAIPRPVVERELRLILGVLDQTIGRMRRPAGWLQVKWSRRSCSSESC